jgi:hypothetical protein
MPMGQFFCNIMGRTSYILMRWRWCLSFTDQKAWSGQTKDYKIFAYPLNTQHERERAKTGWLRIRIMCPSGVLFQLASSIKNHSSLLFFFADLDECSSWGNNCTQICRNVKGSYKCECHKGFKDSRSGTKNGGQCKATPGFWSEFVFCFVCLLPVSCVPNVASVSGLFIHDYPSVFSNVYLQMW